MVSYYLNGNSDVEIVYTENERYSFPVHNHISTYTIGLVLDGRVCLHRKNRSADYGENQFFVIPPYEPHGVSADAPYTMISVSINADLVRRRRDITAIVLNVADSLVSKDRIPPACLPILKKAMDTLCLHGMPDHGCDDPIRRAKEAIEAIPQRNVTIDQLSQSAFMSKYHFIREFKRQVGLTPHSFQIQNRIRRARRILREDRRASMTQVALATGFYDQSHFIKSFTRAAGVSPSQYTGAQHRVDA